jgi:hypothetical protein
MPAPPLLSAAFFAYDSVKSGKFDGAARHGLGAKPRSVSPLHGGRECSASVSERFINTFSSKAATPLWKTRVDM